MSASADDLSKIQRMKFRRHTPPLVGGGQGVGLHPPRGRPHFFLELASCVFAMVSAGAAGWLIGHQEPLLAAGAGAACLATYCFHSAARM